MHEVFKEVIKSKKYSDLDKAVIMRICDEVSRKHSKKKEAIKAAKNQLHIIHESFLLGDCYKTAYSILTESEDIIASQGLSKELSLQLLSLHASTKERISFIEETFSWLSGYIDSDSTVMDIGCGFNPFAIPFLIDRPQKYVAYDISKKTAELLNYYFSLEKKDFYKAEIMDATVDVPAEFASVLLAFKLLPLIQQQKKGRAFSFLEESMFAKAIVSFPIKSLSGKEKGMLEFYTHFFENGLPASMSIDERTVINNELFYVISK